MKSGWTMRALAGAVVACGMWAGTAGEASGQSLAPVNPAYARWAKEGGEKTAVAPRAPRGKKRGDDGALLGYVPEVADLSYLADLNSSLECGVGAGHASRFDLREQGRVTGAKDQGAHSTCWAYAAMGSLEGAVKGARGGEPDFSEWHMATRHGWNFGVDEGGNAVVAAGYLVRWAGPAAEADGEAESPSPQAHVQRIRWVPGKVAALDNDRIKDSIGAHGPLYAGLW